MKKYFLHATGTIALLALVTGIFAQDEKPATANRHNEDVIVIKPKVNIDTKLTIEIKGDDIKVNGKPLTEYKNADVIITKINDDIAVENRRMAEIDARAPRTRFRGGTTVYGYGNGAGNNVSISTNANKAMLGVGTENTEDNDGVKITSITKESAAAKAGLKEGDIITKINDTKISSPGDLRKAVGKFNPEDKITVTYKRDKKEQKLTATLTKSREATAFTYNAPNFQGFENFDLNTNDNFNFNWNGKPRLGLKAQETEDGKGLKVLDVDEESAADKAGIKEGDIITSFDGTEVNNIDKLKELAEPALTKSRFKVQLTRDGKQQDVEIKIPKKLKSTNL